MHVCTHVAVCLSMDFILYTRSMLIYTCASSQMCRVCMASQLKFKCSLRSEQDRTSVYVCDYACHSVSVASYSQKCLTSAWFWLCSGTHRHTNADWPTVTLLLLKVRRHWPLLSSGRQYRLQMRHFPWSKRYLPTHTHTHTIYPDRQTVGDIISCLFKSEK